MIHLCVWWVPQSNGYFADVAWQDSPQYMSSFFILFYFLIFLFWKVSSQLFEEKHSHRLKALFSSLQYLNWTHILRKFLVFCNLKHFHCNWICAFLIKWLRLKFLDRLEFYELWVCNMVTNLDKIFLQRINSNQDHEDHLMVAIWNLLSLWQSWSFEGDY